MGYMNDRKGNNLSKKERKKERKKEKQWMFLSTIKRSLAALFFQKVGEIINIKVTE